MSNILLGQNYVLFFLPHSSKMRMLLKKIPDYQDPGEIHFI